MKKILFLLVALGFFIFPMTVFGEELIPNATSGILIEADSGKIIFEKDMNKEVAIASMTKMVAQIIILEEIEKGNIKWTDKVKVSKNAADMGGSQIYLSEGEIITIDDLMKGISVASGNDATVAMAEVIAGSEEKFVKMMNDKVKELGLKNTQFKNCTGLDEEGHYSSAYDQAMIARYLVTKHPKVLEYSSIYEDYLREDTENKFWLVNTNKLIRFYEGADGLKTGHTDAAKYCLAATAKRNDLRLIAIVLGENDSKVRNSETMSLLNYGFNNLKVDVLKNSGEVVKKIKLDKADREIVPIVLKDNLYVIEEQSSNKNKYDYKVVIDEFELPIKKGDSVGKIKAYSNNKVIAEANLTVLYDIKRISFLSLYKKTLLDLITGVY